MNLKVLLLILGYYSFIALLIGTGLTLFSDAGITTDVVLNDSAMSSSEIDDGGFFSTGISFTRFILLISFGIGLPSDTPTWFLSLIHI